MKRFLIAIAVAALVGVSFMPTDASARPGFRGGGFHGGGFGFRGGFHHGGFRHGFRRFGPGIGLGLGLGLGLGYPYYAATYPYGYDGCVRPRRVWTPYGWRVRLVNICYAYY